MKAMLIEIKHQLKNILKDILKDKNGLKKSDMCKIQLTCDMWTYMWTIAINFIF